MTELGLPAPIEYRYAAVAGGVDFEKRLITLIAVPWEQPARVEYRSEMWNEVFTRGAVDPSVVASPHRIRVNRDHNKSRTVGKTVQLWPDREEGLVAELRIAKTALGDETLALADDDCLSASIGFGVLTKDQELDRRSMTRRINHAYLDHISLVESPAYTGAKVLSVRDDMESIDAASLQPLHTPSLDDVLTSTAEIERWASERLNKK